MLHGLSAGGVRCWVMGGWGVDALVGHQTRTHHDLDLLVATEDLRALELWLRRRGFVRAYEWPENVPVTLDEGTWDSAFVERHPDGRELDLHAVHVAGDRPRLASTDPWGLPSDTLTGTGEVAGHTFGCVSVEAQRAMHSGYDLPATHLEDLRRLDSV